MSQKKRVVTEAEVRKAAREGRSQLSVPSSAIITPLARDTAKQLNVTFSEQVSEKGSGAVTSSSVVHRKVAIGSDHGGYEMKKHISEHLHSLGWTTLDVGTNSPDACDYPDFAFAVAQAVAEKLAHVGIMIDGVGVGSAIVCNKVPGIRAALAYNEFAAWNARAHNNANVLTLGSRSMGIEVCKRIIGVFLETNFEGGRHEKRVDKITDVEDRFSR